MIKILSGLALGYFLYTKDGRQAMKDTGNYIKEQLNTFLKGGNENVNENEIHQRKDNGRAERSETLYRES